MPGLVCTSKNHRVCALNGGIFIATRRDIQHEEVDWQPLLHIREMVGRSGGAIGEYQPCFWSCPRSTDRTVVPPHFRRWRKIRTVQLHGGTTVSSLLVAASASAHELLLSMELLLE